MPDNDLTNEEYIAKIKSQIYSKDDHGAKVARMGVLFRNVFIESPDGPEVFAYLLKELKYNQVIEHQYEMAMHNIAVRMLEIMCYNNEASIKKQIETWKKF